METATRDAAELQTPEATSTALRRLQPDRRRTRNTRTNHVPERRVYTVAERTTIRRIAGIKMHPVINVMPKDT
ncbi:hypothetical protein DPMN_054063 [Dreissena polymorpha]|uniref:Uncharacterized protein n=1 Tax=Dreissena polymorpha TaxID=45954 RepID=A0A9D4CNU0_DREPO|nr:hypothetical protein DPMN_054063 [Dreissena polymorpha]